METLNGLLEIAKTPVGSLLIGLLSSAVAILILCKVLGSNSLGIKIVTLLISATLSIVASSEIFKAGNFEEIMWANLSINVLFATAGSGLALALAFQENKASANISTNKVVTVTLETKNQTSEENKANEKNTVETKITVSLN